MSKLIYAASLATFKTKYPDWQTPVSPVYRSVVFTTDGYIVTHGVSMKTNLSSGELNPYGLDFTLAGQTATITLDGVAKSITLPVINLNTGTNDALSVNSSSGVFTINHALGNAGWVGNQTIGPTANSSDSINVPQITFDKYGHYQSVINRTATLNKVKQTLNADANTKYLMFGSSASTTTEELQFAAAIKAVASTGTLYATIFNENGTSLVDKYAIKNHASSAGTYGLGTSANYGHVQLSDSTSSNSSTSSGIAATPKAISDALALAKAHTDGVLAANDAMVFKGSIGTGGTVTVLPFINYQAGWTYRVVTAGTYAGIQCEIGDMIIAVKDGPVSGTVVINADWTVVQTNVDGAVTALTTLTNNQLVIGDSATRAVKTLAAGTNNHVLKMVSGNPTWQEHYTSRAILVNGTSFLADSSKTNLKLAGGTSITLTTGADGLVTISTDAVTTGSINKLGFYNTSAIAGNNKGYFNPSGTAELLSMIFDKGLVANNSGNTLTISHSNNIAAQASGKLGAITYDAHGHITGFTEVTSLKSPNVLTFGVGTSLDTFDGSVAKTLKFVGTGAASASYSSGTVTISAVDTHFTTALHVGPISTKANGVTGDGSTYIKLFDDSTLRNQFKISGSRATSVTSDASGNIIIDSLNSWRNVKAFKLADNVPSEVLSTTVGSADLDFGADFLWDAADDGGKLHIGWAEIDINGNVTYSV